VPAQPTRVLLFGQSEEDQRTTQRLLSEIPESRFEVECVPDAEAGLRAIRAGRADVCLVQDVGQEGLGLDFLQAAQAIGCRAPIILLAGQGGPIEDVTAIKVGAADCLPQSELTVSMLRRSIRHALERKQTAEALEHQAQELARSNAELADFAFLVSHDLKEPLRGIQQYSGFLLEDLAGRLDADSQSKLETIARLAERLEGLIESLLEYSRVGRVELAVAETDLQRVVAGVRESLQVRLEQENIEICVPRALPAVRCDSARVGEIFYNLITNAIKYNESPQKKVEVGYRLGEPLEGGADERARAATVFYVRDNGIGIPKRHLNSVFRIFKRLHSREKYGGGTGAGLTLVTKIVERHGGRIWVESELGKGSTFYFTLQPDEIRAS
jgi:light-regulated signal transduction histidine kinase (bacteriophytochrome)